MYSNIYIYIYIYIYFFLGGGGGWGGGYCHQNVPMTASFQCMIDFDEQYKA